MKSGTPKVMITLNKTKGAQIPDAVSSYLCRENTTFMCYQTEQRGPDNYLSITGTDQNEEDN